MPIPPAEFDTAYAAGEVNMTGFQIVVYITDAPSKNACHSEEGRKPRRGNPHQHSGNLEGIATPVCALARNDTEFW